MTFVAQPYERFVDDLLTSLTGGFIREEHRFLGADESYSLSSPYIITSTLKVFGQRNDAYLQFEGGLDYDFDANESAILWKKNSGRLPDDHSYFYMNYYPKEGQRTLTDRNPGSVTTTFAEAFARILAVFHKEAEMIYRSAFLDLSSGSSIDHIATLLGLARKEPKYAIGEILLKRSTPATGDITIPAGTLVSTDDGKNFETSDKRTLLKGQLSVVVPIRAQVEGPPGQVEAGNIKNINRPIFGIEAVINEKNTYFASSKESDNAFRRRIESTLERAGKATVNAIKFGLIEAVPEITDGNIQVTERTDTPGLVEVKLGLEKIGDAEWVRQVEEAIFASRPAGVRVTHNLPSHAPLPAAESPAGVKPTKYQSTSFPPEVLAPMPEGLLRLQAAIALYLVEKSISAGKKESIEGKVRQEVISYIESLPMGTDIVYNKLLGRIMQIEEISDARLRIDADAAAEPAYSENLSASGRKASIDPKKIYISLMEEIVQIRITVNLEPKTSASGKENGKLRSAEEKIRPTVEALLGNAALVLKRDDLQTNIKIVVDSETDFKLVETKPITLSAMYEETGRLLNITEKVDLAENQVARLDKLDVRIKGGLDV